MSEKEYIFVGRAQLKTRDYIHQIEQENRKLNQEIERLNNIINELEGELERESNMKEEDTCLEHNTFIDVRNTLKTVLKRLQELKGEDKE